MTATPPHSEGHISATASGQAADNDGVTHEAVIIDEPAVADLGEELIIDDDSDSAESNSADRGTPFGVPPQQVVYIKPPSPPEKLGNRGAGVFIAILSTLVFTALVALATAVIRNINTDVFDFDFLSRPSFYLPTIFFVLAFVLLALVANRANWWAYILGSILVGFIVYFGTIGFDLLLSDIISSTLSEASLRFRQELANPFVIVPALLAREVCLWCGALISRRGRKVTARNTELREAYERELAGYRERA
ncbi:MAG: hypothetical protein ACRCSP_03350 [Rhodoglobus sp.]